MTPSKASLRDAAIPAGQLCTQLQKAMEGCCTPAVGMPGWPCRTL